MEMHHAIKLPSPAECEAITQAMLRARGMPGCIGAMDGKHFEVTAGASDNISFQCYKGFRSITVLGLVNHVYKFTWISDFWPGMLKFDLIAISFHNTLIACIIIRCDRIHE